MSYGARQLFGMTFTALCIMALRPAPAVAGEHDKTADTETEKLKAFYQRLRVEARKTKPRVVRTEKLLRKVRKHRPQGKHRQQLIRAMIKRLTRKVTPDEHRATGKPTPYAKRLEAIEILGEIRAVEAAPLLARNINVLVYERYTTDDWGSPCARALINIGKPSTPVLLARLAGKQSERERYLCLFVLDQIESAKVVEYFLRREISKAKSPVKKTNLKAALKELRKDYME